MLFWMVKKILTENKLRALVPLMGIIIGVASIMGIFAISSGGKVAIKQDLASIADNRVMIGSDNGFDYSDLQLIESLPIVKYVYSPEMRAVGTVISQRNSSYNDQPQEIKIEGYTRKAILNKQLEVNGEKYLRGKNILIGNKIANEIFGSEDVVGKRFQMELGNGQRIELRVLGVYKEELGDSFGGGAIYMDADELKKIGNNLSIMNLMITYEDGEDREQSSDYIIKLLSKKNYRNRYVVLDGNSKYQKIEKIKKMLNMFLGAVGIVALIMGGLGVSNLLANLVREMTPSIGILRTMGMAKEQILKLFLLEATILSTVGGILGIIFGCIGAYVVGEVIGIPSVFYISQIIIVFIVSVGMGIIFGSIPAWKAAQLEVVEALKI